MKDIYITILSNGEVSMSASKIGYNGENKARNIIIELEKPIEDGTAVLEIDQHNKKYFLTLDEREQKYVLPIYESLLAYSEIKMQFRLVKDDNIIIKSRIFEFEIEDSINAIQKQIPEEYSDWFIDVSNRLNELETNSVTKEEIADFIKKDVDDLDNYTKTTDLERDYAKKADITSVYRYKGSVDKYTELADKEAEAQTGDTYDVKENGKNYTWNGSEWDDLGGTFDLSDYVTKGLLDETLNGKHVDIGDAKAYILSGKQIIEETPDFKNIDQEQSTGKIYKGTDKYGDTYYFRGNVIDNYFKFADKFWRIIRINGNNTIRLIYDGTTAHENSDTSEDRQLPNILYNELSDNKKYVGLRYSDDDIHGNDTPSNMLGTDEGAGENTLNKWYEDNIKDTDFEKYVDINTEFVCDRTNTSNSYTPYDKMKDDGTDTNTTFGAHYRIFQASPAAPIFTCRNDKDYFTSVNASDGNKSLVYPIGLLTVDEAVFAGGKYNSDCNYYLNTGNRYFTLSPAFYNKNAKAQVHNIDAAGKITNSTVNNSYIQGVKPVINIVANAGLKGNGTIDEPYEINTGIVGGYYNREQTDEIIDEETRDLLQGLSRELKPDEENGGFSPQTTVSVKNKSGATELIMEIDNLDITTDVPTNSVLGTLKGQDLEDRLKALEEGGAGSDVPIYYYDGDTEKEENKIMFQNIYNLIKNDNKFILIVKTKSLSYNIVNYYLDTGDSISFYTSKVRDLLTNNTNGIYYHNDKYYNFTYNNTENTIGKINETEDITLNSLSYLIGKNNTTEWTPSTDYGLVHKKYVDDAIVTAVTGALEGEY